MFRCVVVIRKNLCEQHVHVVSRVVTRVRTIRNADLGTVWGRIRCCGLFGHLLLHTLVSQVEHLVREGLRHDTFARGTGSLRNGIICVRYCVRSFRFCRLF